MHAKFDKHVPDLQLIQGLSEEVVELLPFWLMIVAHGHDFYIFELAESVSVLEFNLFESFSEVVAVHYRQVNVGDNQGVWHVMAAANMC